MSSFACLPTRLPGSVLPDAIFDIVTDYLACASEAEEARFLQLSQESESLDNSHNKTIQKIWDAFVNGSCQKNEILSKWIQECCSFPSWTAEIKILKIQSQMEDYISSENEIDAEGKSLGGSAVVDSIREQFPKRDHNFSRLEALRREMDIITSKKFLKVMLESYKRMQESQKQLFLYETITQSHYAISSMARNQK